MKVELLSHTPDALNLLLRTKNTRLQHDDDPAAWSEEKKLEHLAYMRDTIKSSWEFVDYTFEITEVTRAFTHQLVRTRTGSYAQESQRTVDVGDHGYLTPDSLREAGHNHPVEIYAHAMDDSLAAYNELISLGVPVQDARGVLPTNLHTSIIAKYTLRALHDMALVRLCTRTQGEYQQVFRMMKAAVVAVHPWAEPFIRVACAQTGVCQFPRYKACPIQRYTYNGANPSDHNYMLRSIQSHWEGIKHEAVPVAHDGRTM